MVSTVVFNGVEPNEVVTVWYEYQHIGLVVAADEPLEPGNRKNRKVGWVLVNKLQPTTVKT
jgi:hypothetical protein